MALFKHEDSYGLGSLEAFRGLSKSDLAKIVRVAQHATLPANWPLLHESTPADALYIVLAGRMGVYVGGARVAEIGAGEIVGEAALLQGHLRSATISTIEPGEFLRVAAEDMNRLMAEIPALKNLVEDTAERHRAGSAARHEPPA